MAAAGAFDQAMQGAIAWGESGPKDTESAWEELSKGVQALKRQQEVLGSHPEQAILAVLTFLVAHGTRRKVLRNRIGECLALLLSHEEWLRAATACPETRVDLQTFLGDEKSTAIFSSRPVQPPVKVSQEESDAQAMQNAQDESDLQDVRKQFVDGVNIIRQFNWSFPPPDSQTTVSDTATEGFKQLQTAVSRLSVIATRKTVHASTVARLLHDFDEVWPGLCQFLAGMRQQPQRKTYSGQIDFLVAKLSGFSPNFAMAAEEHFYLKLPDDQVAAIELESPDDGASEELAKALQKQYDDELEELRSNTQGIFPAGTMLQWMWADARILPLPGMKVAAAANPARWSAPASPEEMAGEFSTFASDRPIRLYIQGHLPRSSSSGILGKPFSEPFKGP
eukprot:TRINITY_DN14069_c0_g1_i1.p1 TRINITY_DN14069_c0_g1~~TRINITY_DN14069_c0_g1_i1.p1  ORF type:complete len:404 (+),score=77.43 TRINITY_DN14069_c0_g1_i1:33-1214(+)